MLRSRTKIIGTIMCFMFMVTFCGQTDAMAKVSGKGTEKNPYIVSTFDELKNALTVNALSGQTTFIAVNGKIEITKKIYPEKGTYSIYANSSNAMLLKSTNKKAEINNQSSPAHCMGIGTKGKTVVNIGCKGNYNLTLGGNRNFFTSNKLKSNGWMYVEEGSSVVLGEKTVVQNMICNYEKSNTASFCVKGKMTVKCVMKNLYGVAAGAIVVKDKGTLEMSEKCKITNCTSKTNGGAVSLIDEGKIKMAGSIIEKCSTDGYGGGIYAIGGGVYVFKGSVRNCEAGKSGGGIFAGYGARLELGMDGTYGPTIENNQAGLNGGGVAANGGTNDSSGGTFCYYKAEINNNASGKFGGGVYIGKPGKKGNGHVIMERGTISKNTSKSNGGGMYISQGNKGNDKNIIYNNFDISNNASGENGGGIYTMSCIRLRKCHVISNKCNGRGGGIYVHEEGECTMRCGNVSGNTAGVLGDGIFLKGKLNIGYMTNFSKDDEIYIEKDKYVNVDKKFVDDKKYIATIDSKVKTEGTKVIKVSYDGGTAERLLYGSNSGEEDEYELISKNKRFNHETISMPKLLRSTGYVSGMGNEWIIISKRYDIKYNAGTVKYAENMPSLQYKFYGEPITLSKKEPNKSGWQLNKSLSWNDKINGNGIVYKPGIKFTINKDMVLYAIWKEDVKPETVSVSISAPDRYYVLGQKVVLNENEVLKKVKVKDSNGKTDYKISIIKINDDGKTVFSGSVLAENSLSKYMTTSSVKQYELRLEVSRNNIKDYADMSVYIVGDNDVTSGVRFISSEYLYTLSEGSKWSKGENKQKLMESLQQKNVMTYYFSSDDIKKIKEEMVM